jgi:hypothetical protein
MTWPQTERRHGQDPAAERREPPLRPHGEQTPRIVELHDGGVAWTVAADVARGDEDVAELRRVRDIAQGLLGVAEARAFRTAADRRSLDALVSWSMRRELAES